MLNFIYIADKRTESGSLRISFKGEVELSPDTIIKISQEEYLKLTKLCEVNNKK